MSANTVGINQFIFEWPIFIRHRSRLRLFKPVFQGFVNLNLSTKTSVYNPFFNGIWSRIFTVFA